MRFILLSWALLPFVVLLPANPGQTPLLHYTFSEGGAPATTENIGTVPGPSVLTGHTVNGTGANRTKCLLGVTGAANDLTTPYNVALGTSSWTIGFALNTTSTPGFQYIFSEGGAGGAVWRCFTDGSAGAGNIRMTGSSGIPTVDIAGGAGSAGWVHVAWVHDTAADQLHAYLNGVIVSTTAAAGVTASSGLPLIIGRFGGSSLLTGNRVDEFRLYGYALTAAQVAAWSANALSDDASFAKLMISEASWGAPEGLEVTNFTASPVNLANWRVRWRDGAVNLISDPLNVSIAAGESIVIVDDLVGLESVPSGTQVLDRFAADIPTSFGAFTVALCDAVMNTVDEVRVSDTAGVHPGFSFGSAFRGLATRSAGTANQAQAGVERIWGLDSDGGADWTEQGDRGFGRENRSSGPRGTDPTPIPTVKINEIDDSPADFIELHNPSANLATLSGWFFLFSPSQGSAHSVATIPLGTVMFAGGYLVIGDQATAPAELPVGVQYVDVGAIPFTTSELDCALYDNLGRLVDIVRATRQNSQLVHNFPRAPSYWSDFVGAALRPSNGGANAFGRNQVAADANTGADWFPIFTRTMGSANLSTTLAGPAGHGDSFDVRLNETSLGQGFQAIMNAGPAASSQTWNFLVSIGHSTGQGLFLGLGADALANLPLFYNVPPFSGTLDAMGSARFELAPGTFLPGIDADFIFVRQLPGGALAARTLVIAFDT